MVLWIRSNWNARCAFVRRSLGGGGGGRGPTLWSKWFWVSEVRLCKLFCQQTNSSSWSNETALVPDWSSAPLPSNSSVRNTAMAIGSATAAIVLLALLVACVVRGRRRPHQAGCWWERVKGHRGIHALAKSAVLNNQLFTNNPNYYSSSPDAAVLKALGRFEIEREKLTFVDEIGEGCFGKVYRGMCIYTHLTFTFLHSFTNL